MTPHKERDALAELAMWIIPAGFIIVALQLLYVIDEVLR